MIGVLVNIGGVPLVLEWAFAYLGYKYFISMIKSQHSRHAVGPMDVGMTLMKGYHCEYCDRRWWMIAVLVSIEVAL